MSQNFLQVQSSSWCNQFELPFLFPRMLQTGKTLICLIKVSNHSTQYIIVCRYRISQEFVVPSDYKPTDSAIQENFAVEYSVKLFTFRSHKMVLKISNNKAQYLFIENTLRGASKNTHFRSRAAAVVGFVCTSGRRMQRIQQKCAKI